MTRLQVDSERELMALAKETVRARVQPKTWEAFRLTTFEQHSGAEAAARLGMKVGAVFVASSKVRRMNSGRIRPASRRIGLRCRHEFRIRSVFSSVRMICRNGNEEARMNSPCPDERSLEALLASSADSDESERSSIEAHLDECERCQDRLLALPGRPTFLRWPTMPCRIPNCEPRISGIAEAADLAGDHARMAAIVMKAFASFSGGHSHAWPELPGLEIVETLGGAAWHRVQGSIQKGIDRVVAVKVVPLGDRPDENSQPGEDGRDAAGKFRPPEHRSAAPCRAGAGAAFRRPGIRRRGDLKKALVKGPGRSGGGRFHGIAGARGGPPAQRRVVHADNQASEHPDGRADEPEARRFRHRQDHPARRRSGRCRRGRNAALHGSGNIRREAYGRFASDRRSCPWSHPSRTADGAHAVRRTPRSVIPRTDPDRQGPRRHRRSANGIPPELDAIVLK